jgi:DNA-binding IclR family transcriptional regulator
VVASTCAVLRLLGRAERPMGVNAIARELSIPPSSCFKMMRCLHAEGFVECDERDKSYSLGLEIASLSRRALDPTNAFAVLRPMLDRVAEEQSIAIGLWRLLPNRRIVLTGFCEGSTTQMRIQMTLGQRVPRLIGAVGRSIAADLNLTAEEMRQEYDQLQWQTEPSFEGYLADVERTRRLGYALDVGNFALSVCTVATTIKDDAGDVRFGISGITFNRPYDEAEIDRIGRALVELSRAAALRLGLVTSIQPPRSERS